MDKTMIRLKITTGKKIGTEECKVIDFTNVLDYWKGSMHIIPHALRNMHLSDYENNKCLTWYERQQLHHDTLKEEFKKIFKWQSK